MSFKLYASEGYVILSPTQLIISLLLILADSQHVSALFKSPSHWRGILVQRLSTGRPDDGDLNSAKTCCLSANINNK
jgi:hypothetical protein